MLNAMLWVVLTTGEIAIPMSWLVIAFGAMATVIGCLWRDNLKLRAALLKEKEEKVSLCQGILNLVRRTRRYDS